MSPLEISAKINKIAGILNYTGAINTALSTGVDNIPCLTGEAQGVSQGYLDNSRTAVLATTRTVAWVAIQSGFTLFHCNAGLIFHLILNNESGINDLLRG